ncbi:hypothetical protein E1301_Tti018269 [Triplophysa tibetana]|uniref:Uncharacterized protein n=1 Tax=Triplophysa tibetana TaxID=1572043 RepID=A0A5A9NJ57_9TELE|nr:hypothetical protein E1301_Tti018269 [Triplophysa tibetana]
MRQKSNGTETEPPKAPPTRSLPQPETHGVFRCRRTLSLNLCQTWIRVDAGARGRRRDSQHYFEPVVGALRSSRTRPTPFLYLPVSLHQRTDLKCLFRYGMRASSESGKLAGRRESSDMIVSICQQMRAARSAGGQIMSAIVQHRALCSC